MALELVAGAFLSASLDLLFEKMGSREFVDFIRGKKNGGKKIEEGLKKLKTMLLSANRVLNDAEWKQITDKDVRQWLQELRDEIFNAEDLVYEINTEALRCKIEGDQSRRRKILSFKVRNSNPSRFNANKVEERIEKILSMLQFLLDQKEALRLVEGVETRPFPRISEATMVKESDIYGRDADKDAIMKLVLSDHEVSDDKICVIPIVGMGGIGKTTLAQLVYKDIDNKAMEKPFDLKAWITVSDESDLFTLTKMIYERVAETKNCHIKEIIQLQYKLDEFLRGKKFLLVLDDVWNVNYEIWCNLKIPFESAENGSKIILTTRQESIASAIGNVQKHDLQMMSEKDSWLLFSKHAFSGSLKSSANRHHLEKIGQKIVKKCKGLPLAVKSLGCLLRSELDPRGWERILENDIWDVEKNNILPALWLSYYHLPHHLKRCFAYCSIFPKDYEIQKEELILLWMAEDLLQPQKSKTLEEVGEEYFNDLASRSFFHVEQNSECFTMHDLVNDLAKFVLGETCLRLDDNYSPDHVSKARYFSCMASMWHNHMKKFEDLFGNEVLRTLLVSNSPINSKRLQSMQYLRALTVSNQVFTHEGPLIELLDSIGCLKLLRYLDLSYLEIKELPNTIWTLYNLQTLLLRDCDELTRLPDSIGNLRQLSYLDLSRTAIAMIPNTICNLHGLHTLKLVGCRQLTSLPTNFTMLSNLRHLQIFNASLKEMPPGLSKLKNLQSLDKFVVGKNRGSNINELGKLRDLHGGLHITSLENVANAEEVFEAILKDKMNISGLQVEWNGDTENSEVAWKVLDRLHPHTNVKSLYIENYGGKRFPGWIGNSSFSCMKSVRLYNCKYCCLLPPLGQLPSLEILEIRGFDLLERIGDEFYYTDGCSAAVSKPFESLKVLNFSSMKKWKEWSLIRGGSIEGGGGGGVFSNLVNLQIWDCEELNGACLPDYLPSLTTLDISGSSEQLLGSLSRCEYPSLELLDIDNCPKIKSFPKGRLPSNIKKIKITECSELVSLSEEGWPCNLKSLKIDRCRKLFAAAQPMRWNLRMLTSLTSLKLSYMIIEADSFPEEWQLPTTLTSLKLNNLWKFKSLNGMAFQHLTSLQKLEIMDCHQLQCFPEEEQGLLPTSLTSLSLWYLDIKSLNSKTFRRLTSLQKLKITGCQQLRCLPEERLPASLSQLDITGCPLLSPRCQRVNGEDWPKIAHVPRIQINYQRI